MGSWRLSLLLTGATLLCCARGGSDCLMYKTAGSGWGSNMIGMLMTLAANPQADLVLDETGWGYKCSDEGSWRRFFVGTVPMTREECRDPDACEPVQYSQCGRCGHDLLMGRPVQETFPIMLDALRRVWKLSDSMQLRADIQAAYLASLPKPLIGIHIRAGDKSHENKMAGRDILWFRKQGWVQVLQELLVENGLDQQSGGTCLMFGDQLLPLQQAAATLKTDLRCTTILVGGSLQGHDQFAFNEQNRTAACDSTRELILSLEAMAKSDVFIGSLNSNIPRFVLLLRSMYGKGAATSRDVIKDSIGWHHNDMAYWHH